MVALVGGELALRGFREKAGQRSTKTGEEAGNVVTIGPNVDVVVVVTVAVVVVGVKCAVCSMYSPLSSKPHLESLQGDWAWCICNAVNLCVRLLIFEIISAERALNGTPNLVVRVRLVGGVLVRVWGVGDR